VTLLYAEVPRFYAELERVADPSLAERPVIVGGDPRKRGLVQSATLDALAQGVEIGMPVLRPSSAARGAPAATNMRAYRELAGRLRAVFRRASPRVEAAGLEAAYLDPSGGDEAAEALALRLQREVREALRLPLRVGIASLKFVARLAAEESGERGVRRVVLGGVRGSSTAAGAAAARGRAAHPRCAPRGSASRRSATWPAPTSAGWRSGSATTAARSAPRPSARGSRGSARARARGASPRSRRSRRASATSRCSTRACTSSRRASRPPSRASASARAASS
jgi:hypothetical protein